MKHIGLFEGIGGFSLAARWMGWETVAWCEWNEFGQKVLSYHFPDAEGFGDITKTDFTKYANKIDILTGGFPCQPYSIAGKRLGTEDDRHLWPEMLRAIKEIQPSWVVGENVLGLVNWSGGLVFHEVQADLEAAGYEVFPYVLPACAVNAPHRRDRVWFIAYSVGNGHRRQSGLREDSGKEGTDKSKENKRERIWDGIEGDGTKEFTSDTNSSGNNTANRSETGIRESASEIKSWNRGASEIGGLNDEQYATDTCGIGLERSLSTGKHERQSQQIQERGQVSEHLHENESGIRFQNFPTESPICSRDDGLSYGLDDITFSKWRTESIKAYGNAIVPQIAVQIFKAIEICHKKL